jgi:Rhodopirellula transposase DDE domain
LIWPYLDERQRRLLLAAGARGLGRGGISKVARVTGASRQMVHTGLVELEDPTPRSTWLVGYGGLGWTSAAAGHRPGSGPCLGGADRPRHSWGSQSPLRWTCKSTRQLAQALTAQGHPVSDDTVGKLLKQQGYRLQRTQETLESAQHPDRDARFRYLNEQAREHSACGARKPRFAP